MPCKYVTPLESRDHTDLSIWIRAVQRHVHLDSVYRRKKETKSIILK